MNTYTRWFSRVVWIGIPVNLLFAVPALFAPDALINTLDLEEDFETVWLRNAGLLIFIITFFYVPIALAPSRYPAVSWLIVAGRLLAAAFFFQVVYFGEVLNSSDRGEAFIPFMIGDLTLGTVQGVLLYLGLRKEAGPQKD